MDVREIGISEWGDVLPETGFDVFHTPEALQVVDAHTPGELRLFGGFKGKQPVGLLPVFIRERAGVRMVFSPPPSVGVQKLGPVMMSPSPKPRKQEGVNRRFTEKILDTVDANSSTALFRMTCTPNYGDPRPYSWNDFDVKPKFTYRLDLESKATDDVLGAFSSSLRREIRDSEETDITIQRAESTAARDVHESTQRRFEEQGINYPLSEEYVYELVTALDDRARVYVAEDEDDTFLSGIIALYSNDTAYFWKGGTRQSHHDISVNTLLHWRIIKDIIEDPPRKSITQYDLYTANNDQISRYKSKFGGDLVPYYQVESAGLPMTAAKKAYRMTTYGEELLYGVRNLI